MDIAEPFFEAHHRLAIGVKTEVAGLDDTGMDRPDRNLMQRRTFGSEERVGISRRGVGRGGTERMAHAPAAVIEPRSRIHRIVGDETVEIRNRALESHRRRMRPSDRRETPADAREADDAHLADRLVEDGHEHFAAIAPQRDQRRMALRDLEHYPPPNIAIDARTRPRSMCVDPRAEVE